MRFSTNFFTYHSSVHHGSQNCSIRQKEVPITSTAWRTKSEQKRNPHAANKMIYPAPILSKKYGKGIYNSVGRQHTFLDKNITMHSRINRNLTYSVTLVEKLFPSRHWYNRENLGNRDRCGVKPKTSRFVYGQTRSDQCISPIRIQSFARAVRSRTLPTLMHEKVSIHFTVLPIIDILLTTTPLQFLFP